MFYEIVQPLLVLLVFSPGETQTDYKRAISRRTDRSESEFCSRSSCLHVLLFNGCFVFVALIVLFDFVCFV